MESIVTIIMGTFAVAVVWAVFFYIIGLRKDRKILDDYITGKHQDKRKRRFKRAAVRQAPSP